MGSRETSWGRIDNQRSRADEERERRLDLLLRRLPPRMQGAIRWLRRPHVRWLRIAVGLLLILGGFLSILPILGLWMLPLGLILLADDFRPLRHAAGRILAWIEHRRPHWLGLPGPPRHQSTCPGGENS